jgi:manganese-dependent inorganic pyrophosphatase
MKKDVLVFGHKNPDTDSICSAIAYADLLNQIGTPSRPLRLGEISKETNFALEYFNANKPDLLETVRPTLEEIKSGETASIPDNISIKKALDILSEKNYSSLPVVNDKNQLEYLLHVSEIANAYLDINSNNIFNKYHTTFENIIDVLNGKIINGEKPKGKVSGYLKSLNESTENRNGIALTSNHKDVNENIDKLGIDLLILCSESVCNNARTLKTPVLQTSFGIFKAFKLISLSVSVKSILQKKAFYHFRMSDYIDDVQGMMKEIDQTNFPVVNKKGEVYKTIRNKNLSDIDRTKVVLVDHNEKKQSVDGLKNVEIIEIVDHHKFGDIETSEPLKIRADKVGCTSTIVYEIYQENKIVPNREMAGLMLSAILSDTLIFKSPTTTKKDINAAEQLAKIAGVDPEIYGKEMLIAGASISEMTTNEIISVDRKEFMMNDFKTALAQINTVDIEGLMSRKDEIKKLMEEQISQNSYHLFALVATDILNNGSQVLCFGKNTNLFEAAFDVKLEDNSVWLKRVVSRKKQIVPKLMRASQEI